MNEEVAPDPVKVADELVRFMLRREPLPEWITCLTTAQTLCCPPWDIQVEVNLSYNHGRWVLLGMTYRLFESKMGELATRQTRSRG